MKEFLGWFIRETNTKTPVRTGGEGVTIRVSGIVIEKSLKVMVNDLEIRLIEMV